MRPQATPIAPPSASNRRLVAVFPDSGRFGRRRLPVPFAATSHSPAHPAPPLASPCPCGAAQRLSLDRKPPEPKTHFTPVALSAAELATGESSHHRRPSDHREDRPGLAGPSLPSGALGEPPFVAGDRPSPAPVRAEKRRERGEWSNLTSRPSGPTVSDPRATHAGLSGHVNV